MLSKKAKFQSQAYDDWAYSECMSYIYSHVNQDPIDACEDFRHMMDEAAANAKTEVAKLTFASAYEAATQILDDLVMSIVESIEGGRIV